MGWSNFPMAGFGAAHFRIEAQKLTATTAVFPPEGDPVPGPAGFAFLQTAALEATASDTSGMGLDSHGPTIPSSQRRIESLETESLRFAGTRLSSPRYDLVFSVVRDRREARPRAQLHLKLHARRIGHRL